ncbi:response regulator transcription factor [Herbaspirillum sp. YR522]|uniref:DNA-binding response regulator n=1 Tax=Herbaspirillum sp. YR522 TaxID=1144342 RepID=UPI00026F90C2|nr:response regulator transcription factor [Herbaspirillum sp. YR522]EJN08971.1 response regulator with CheY-like receiver domain and winged-helix DNA-binding domain [Herbaspirillum sp. YR522]
MKKIGILSRRPEPIALLRQLAAARACVVCDSCDAAAQAGADVAVMLVDLDCVRHDPAAVVELVRHGLPAFLILATGDDGALLHALRAAGADDLVLEPIRRSELALRLGLLLQASDPDPGMPNTLQLAEFSFDLQRLQVSRPGTPTLQATLTRKEAELAMLLLQNLGRPLSRAFIQERVWGPEPELPTRTIDTHVSRVRNKLALTPQHGYRLATVYGYGYQLERLDQAAQAASSA